MSITEWLRATLEGLEARIIEHERRKAAHAESVRVLKGFRERQEARLAAIRAENPNRYHRAKAEFEREYQDMITHMMARGLVSQRDVREVPR